MYLLRARRGNNFLSPRSRRFHTLSRHDFLGENKTMPSHLLTILLLGISSNLDTLGVGLAYGTRKFRLPFMSNFICALIPCIGTYLMMTLGGAVRYVISGQLANLLGSGIIMAAGTVLIVQYLRRERSGRNAGPRPESARQGGPGPAPSPDARPGPVAGCRVCARKQVPAPGAQSKRDRNSPGRHLAQYHPARQAEIPVECREPGGAAIAAKPPLSSKMRDLGTILDDPFRVDYDYSGSIELKEASVLAFALTLNNLSCGFAAGLIGLNTALTVGTAFAISLIFFYSGIKIGILYIAHWFGERGDLAAGIMLVLLGLYELLG
jgi:putative Mn2+ efflux pump MntP